VFQVSNRLHRRFLGSQPRCVPGAPLEKLLCRLCCNATVCAIEKIIDASQEVALESE
jgi:hypothetical protein